MDTKKTLRYNWEFGRETVAIRVSSYRNNGNLYVGLCHKEGRDWEDFGDVTINLPYQFLERVKPDAIARIKTSLVLEAVAAAENIVASDDDVDAEIQDMATQYQMKPEELKDMIGAPELENIKKDIASRKALEFLGENCKEV